MLRKLALLSPLLLLLLIAGLIIWGTTAPNDNNDVAVEEKVVNLIKKQWIEGTWHRVDTVNHVSFFESWSPLINASFAPNRGTLIWADSILGTGYSVNGGDTTVWENLIIDTRPKRWTFTAKVKNQDAVVFTESERGDSMITFENLSHDFPKHIKYVRTNNRLNATVWNETETLHFAFTLKHE